MVHNSMWKLLILLKGLFTYFKKNPCGRYGRLYGVTDRSNHAAAVTGVYFLTIRDTIKFPVLATGIENI